MANSARIDDLKVKFDENPRRYFAPLANEYRKAGDPDQAIALCREFLPQQPGHMSGHIVYGQALYDAKQLDEAKLVFDTALTLDPENLIALRYMGDIARGLGDPASARMWYQRVLDADPRNDEITGLLTEMIDAPQAPPSAPAPAEPIGPAVVATDMVEGLTGSTLPEIELAKPPLAVPAAEAAEATAIPEPTAIEPVVAPEAVPPTPFTPPTPPAMSAEPEADVARDEPAEVPAPAGDELLDLDYLNLASGEPNAPEVHTPRPSVETTGFDVERADDGLLMPMVDAATESLTGGTTASESDPAAEADAFPLDDLDLATPDQPPPSTPAMDPFATETMAELYLSQGHHGDALRVYRQLLAQRPGDAGLQAKVAELESTATTPPSAAPPPQQVPDLDASSFRFDLGTDSGEAQPAGEFEATAPDTGELVIEPPAGLLTDELTGRGSVPDAVVRPATPVSYPAPEFEADHILPAPPSGPSIREFLAALGSHVLGGEPGGSELPEREEQGAEPAAAVAGAEGQELVVEANAADEPASAPGVSDVAEDGAVSAPDAPNGGSRNLLFDSATVSDEDQMAAEGLAEAYGASPKHAETPTKPIQGAPARRATEELSLDSVFRNQRSPGAAPESRSFSFDKFFANPTPAMGSSIMESSDSGEPSETVDDDIEQFNSWLDGLKKR